MSLQARQKLLLRGQPAPCKAPHKRPLVKSPARQHHQLNAGVQCSNPPAATMCCTGAGNSRSYTRARHGTCLTAKLHQRTRPRQAKGPSQPLKYPSTVDAKKSTQQLSLPSRYDIMEVQRRDLHRVVTSAGVQCTTLPNNHNACRAAAALQRAAGQVAAESRQNGWPGQPPVSRRQPVAKPLRLTHQPPARRIPHMAPVSAQLVFRAGAALPQCSSPPSLEAARQLPKHQDPNPDHRTQAQNSAWVPHAHPTHPSQPPLDPSAPEGHRSSTSAAVRTSHHRAPC